MAASASSSPGIATTVLETLAVLMNRNEKGAPVSVSSSMRKLLNVATTANDENNCDNDDIRHSRYNSYSYNSNSFYNCNFSAHALWQELQQQQQTPPQQTLEDQHSESKNRTEQLMILKRYQPVTGDSRYLFLSTQSSTTTTSATATHEDDILPYGHVMRELGQRILWTNSPSSSPSPSSTSSSLLKRSPIILLEQRQSTVVTFAASSSSVATNLARAAQLYGHEIHEIDAQHEYPYLDQWWESHQNSRQRVTSSCYQQSWLLTILDHPREVFSSDAAAHAFLSSRYTDNNNNYYNCGEKSGPSNTTTTATINMKYIITSVTATTGGHYTPPYNYSFQGVETVLQLIHHQYKIQLLSVSDFWNGGSLDYVNANDIITHDNILDFLQWGAKAAATSQHMMMEDDNNNDNTGRTQSAQHATFKAYFFCTRNLDMAIPSRRLFLKKHRIVKKDWEYPYWNASAERHMMVSKASFQSCPTHHKQLKVAFADTTTTTTTTTTTAENMTDPWDAIVISCNGDDITARARQNQSKRVELWMNNARPSRAEAVCIKLRCSDFFPDAEQTKGSTPQSFQVACSTRIVLDQDEERLRLSLPTQVADDDTIQESERPNILILQMNSLSRPQFDFIMPRTASTLLKDEYLKFNNYATVGDDPSANRMALYAGKRCSTMLPSTASTRWIWEHLREDLGYATFLANDGCNRVDSRRQRRNGPTAATHGTSMQELFCFHFARPNCVGHQLAAHYALNHTKQFMETYEARNPWAAFVALVDTEEDSQTMGAIIDKAVANFLKWTTSSPARMRNTVVLVLSDNGLHYGSYFHSVDGERERSQPLLYMKIPETLGGNRRLMRNVNAWITPFDVLSTLLHFVGINQDASSAGSCLYKDLSKSRKLCQNATSIPRHHCHLLDPSSAITTNVARNVPFPPSLMSYYADVPRDHRYQNNVCIVPKYNITQTFRKAKTIREKDTLNNNQPCNCSTSHRDWFPCTENPWGEDSTDAAPPSQTAFPEETFLMVSCPSQPLQLETRVVRNETRVEESNAKTQHFASSSTSQQPRGKPPNILILEVDSVSVEYADRHFKKTRELLRRFRPVKSDGSTSNHTCPGGRCAVDFSKFEIVGPNSITNQVASLSGCIATMRHESCWNEKSQVGELCNDTSLYEHGMRLRSNGPRDHVVYCPADEITPFLYDIANDRGYITFFGEEFCYPGSLYVVQNNVFPLNADVEIHQVFCRATQRRNPEQPVESLYKLASKDRCLDDTFFGVPKQEIGLDILFQMWAAYDDVPRFAYLNAMAAHVYTGVAPLQSLNAEEYDESLFSFLQKLFERSDAGNTVIIVRSDHGLQGGTSAPVDYSTQIEQRHPWTEIIVPRNYPVDQLVENSDKEATPFDLYTTIRSLMESTQPPEQQEKWVNNKPRWTTNLLHEAIAPKRSCQERRVPQEYCPNNAYPFPTFGICNMFEAGQAVFCRDPTNGGTLFPTKLNHSAVASIDERL